MTGNSWCLNGLTSGTDDEAREGLEYGGDYGLELLFVIRFSVLAVFVYCRSSPLPDCCRPYISEFIYYCAMACRIYKNGILHTGE